MGCLDRLFEKYDRLFLFDTETTGLIYNRDEIIEFAAVVVERREGKPAVIREYDELIEKLGGVDLCLGGLGINGHVAFNEAAEADAPITADEFANLNTRVLPISRETRTINAYGYQRGDLAGMCEWCITIGMRQIIESRKIYIALNRPWQNGPFKHSLYDIETGKWPASLLRRNQNLQYCVVAEVFEGIE